MIEIHPTANSLAFALLSIGSWLVAGMMIGGFHFLTLRWNVRVLAAGGSLLPAVTIQFGRFAAVAIILAVIAGYSGALALLATAAGIVTARSLIIRFGAGP
jgi:hypothetical protein